MQVALLGFVLVVTVFLSGETMAVSRHVPTHETADDHASDQLHSTHQSLGHRSSSSYYSSGHHSGEQTTSRTSLDVKSSRWGMPSVRSSILSEVRVCKQRFVLDQE
ncbi:hypothetical protein AC1031_021595 [Aphanomyces cochlioides]|nr:hypothetical protein AC1031_021595 [Aphanomyces cochlioides]